MLITSKDNEKLKYYKKLKLKKHRDYYKKFIVEGNHLVLEAYKAGVIEELILEKDDILSLPIETIYLEPQLLKSISNLDTPSNQMALCKMKTNDFIGNKVILIDGIQDPGNLGTIIRSAVAFNIDTIILGDNTVDIYNPKVIRASQGMIFNINIINRNLLEIIPELQNKGHIIYGTKVTHGKELKSIEKTEKFAVALGNEGLGLSEEVEELCDIFLHIKMNETCQSLNVSIAASIVLYELS